jgi:Cof subfamily protein (haloacid dehalogenase superfamily)
MIEAIITDLDGTLLSPDGTISNANKAMLQKAIDKGIRVILASGRRYLSAERFAKELNLKDYIIAYSGGWIKRIIDAKPVISFDMPLLESAQYIKMVKNRVDLVGAYIDDTFYVEQKNESLTGYETRSHLKAVEVDDVSDFIMANGNKPTKIFTLANPEILEIISAEMSERFFGVLDFVKSWDNYLEVGPTGITKGSALKILAQMTNLNLDNSVFFGDQQNDLPAMEVCGLSVAMGNATQEVKDKASMVAPDNSQDGVARVLERII